MVDDWKTWTGPTVWKFGVWWHLGSCFMCFALFYFFQRVNKSHNRLGHLDFAQHEVAWITFLLGDFQRQPNDRWHLWKEERYAFEQPSENLYTLHFIFAVCSFQQISLLWSSLIYEFLSDFHFSPRWLLIKVDISVTNVSFSVYSFHGQYLFKLYWYAADDWMFLSER